MPRFTTQEIVAALTKALSEQEAIRAAFVKAYGRQIEEEDVMGAAERAARGVWDGSHEAEDREVDEDGDRSRRRFVNPDIHSGVTGQRLRKSERSGGLLDGQHLPARKAKRGARLL